MSKIGKKVNPIRPGAPIVSPAAPSAVISVEKNSFHFFDSSENNCQFFCQGKGR